MTLSAELGQRLHAAARSVAADPLDRFPPLITFSCLSDATNQLAAAALTHLERGAAALTETLTMPRRGFGPRPVELLSPASRALYTALVSHLDDALPPASRQPGSWTDHREFGREGEHSYVVELDFASCYELIDHADLKEELLLRSFDSAAVNALGVLLRGVGRHGRGIPQMLPASDRLADAYLDVIDRRLMRSGFTLHRFADDVRVLAESWNQANEIIEEAAAHARSLSLILSSAKTGVRRREVLDESEAEAFSLLKEYFDEVRTSLSEIVVVTGPYGAPEFGVEDPDDADALGATYVRILEDWHEAFRESQDERQPLDLPGGLSSHINTALMAAADVQQALDVDLLADLIFHYPTRLEATCRYFLQRRETKHPTKRLGAALLRKLTSMGRQSSWAKLWLLHVTAEVENPPTDVLDWVRSQLVDAHETVRAEAAWTSACHGVLETSELELCYRQATEITAPALSAAAAKQNSTAALIGAELLKAPMVNAIRHDRPLNKEAYTWGL